MGYQHTTIPRGAAEETGQMEPRVFLITGGLTGAERYADRVEFAYVDEAAHFITTTPAAVADLALDWFERAG